MFYSSAPRLQVPVSGTRRRGRNWNAHRVRAWMAGDLELSDYSLLLHIFIIVIIIMTPTCAEPPCFSSREDGHLPLPLVLPLQYPASEIWITSVIFHLDDAFIPKQLTLTHSCRVSVLLKDTSTRAGIEPPTPCLKDRPANHWPTSIRKHIRKKKENNLDFFYFACIKRQFKKNCQIEHLEKYIFYVCLCRGIIFFLFHSEDIGDTWWDGYASREHAGW